MPDLVLPKFPDSLLERVDVYIRHLEELNPGQTWTRTAAISTLLVRSLAEAEGAEVRWCRRNGKDRRERGRGLERRQGPNDRRASRYPEMIDLLIEQVLKSNSEPKLDSSDTWRQRHETDDI